MASGYLLLGIIAKYIYHVCPACAVNDLARANPQLAQTATMMLVALGLHCAMDGLGLAFGDHLLGHPDRDRNIGAQDTRGSGPDTATPRGGN